VRDLEVARESSLERRILEMEDAISVTRSRKKNASAVTRDDRSMVSSTVVEL